MKLVFFLSGLLGMLPAAAQTMFLPAVKVRFERTFSLANAIREMDPSRYNQYKDYIPAAQITYFQFSGNEQASFYGPQTGGNEVNSNYAEFYIENQIYTDLVTDSITSVRGVFAQKYLLADTVLPIKWKFTEDRRTIAGYNCRKAIGVLHDTIAIFAFYTEKILVKGGPESIHGLPGMILGVGIPKIHTTWFATGVEVSTGPLSLSPPSGKGVRQNRKQLYAMIDQTMKDLGNFRKMIIAVII
jgi:GLPGLI family protein